MKSHLYRAALAATADLVLKTASLRAVGAFADKGVDVDFEKGVIRNVAVMTIGPAEGHGFSIDATSIKQLNDLAAAKPNGVEMRFKHPELPGEDGIPDDSLGRDVGYVRDLHIEGDSVRGDAYLADYAEVLPGLGNVKDYLLRKAKSDPTGFGLSAVIGFEVEEQNDARGNVTGVVARIKHLDAIDFVGRPAANPNGLLSKQGKPEQASLCGMGYPTYQGSSMNDLFKRILMELGLPYDCSDEAAQAFFDALTDDMKTEIQTRIAAVRAATNVDLDKAAKDAAAKVAPMSAKAIASAARAALGAQKTTTTNTAALAAKKAGLTNMNTKIKECLAAHFGLPADATDEAAQTFYEALSDTQKADVTAKLASMAAKAKPAENVAQLAASTHEAMLAAEGKRVTMLSQLGDALRLDMADAEDKATVQLAIAKGDDVPAARTRFLERLQAKCKPVEGLGGVRVGEDRNLTSLRAALPQAMLMKMGTKRIYAFDDRGSVVRDAEDKMVIDKIDDRARQLASLRMRDVFREYLSAMGVDAREVQRIDDARLAKAFTRRGMQEVFGTRTAQLAQGFDDFDSILANVQNKSLRIAYNEMPATWSVWCNRRTAVDFKQLSDVQMSDVPNLVAKDEHGRYRRVQVSDSKEVWSLAEYGVIIAITRKALLADDLNVFSTLAQKQAAAARRLEETRAYLVVTANAAMNDTVALFHATHSNLEATTANIGAPSVTTLGAGRKKMRLQTGPKGAYLDLMPKYLLLPASLETVGDQYTSANYVAAVQTSINPFASTGRTPLVPIIQPRLDADSATSWYLAADKNQIDTVKLCFLESEPEPSMTQNEDFSTDDLELKVRHSVAAAALDHRGLYKNPGA